MECSLNTNLKSDRQYFQCNRGYDCRYIRRPIGLHSLILVLGGPESSHVPQSTSSTNPITTSIPTSVASTTTIVAATSEELNVGAIVGGVIGGVAFIVILIFAGVVGVFIFLRRHNRYATTPSTYTPVAIVNDGTA